MCVFVLSSLCVGNVARRGHLRVDLQLRLNVRWVALRCANPALLAASQTSLWIVEVARLCKVNGIVWYATRTNSHRMLLMRLT